MQNARNKKCSSGFTLVELAIVMIIIGLLIGGVLKGRELISNAQTTATIAQIKSLSSAVYTFKDKYGVFPGDMPNPTARLRDCNVSPCNIGGDGNGQISVPDAHNNPPPGSEKISAFPHMAAADLITGVEINGQRRFGSALPEAPIGGGFWVGYQTDGNMADRQGRAGHYLIYNGIVTSAADQPNVDGMEAVRAGQIDRKIDDGSPVDGEIMATGNGCANGQNQYDEANENSSCGLFIKIGS